MSDHVPIDEPHLDIAYHEGAYKPLEAANVNVMTHGFQYGIGCFAGVRAYYNADLDEAFIFRLDDHVARILQSCRILDFQTALGPAQIREIILEVARRNAYRGDAYFRPFFYTAEHRLSPRTHDVRVDFACYALPLGDYIDTSRGLKTIVSSWRRVDDDMIPARAKASGAYLNSALAKSEAIRVGCDEAIFLNRDGHVCEGSTENLFLVSDGVLVTPRTTDNVLEGITRKSLLVLAAEELGLAIEERAVDRTELYSADELFFSGTGAQVAWIAEVDGRPIADGTLGPITAKLKTLYHRVVTGREPKRAGWLTPIFAGIDTARLAGSSTD